jgi:hypothetical protein
VDYGHDYEKFDTVNLSRPGFQVGGGVELGRKFRVVLGTNHFLKDESYATQTKKRSFYGALKYKLDIKRFTASASIGAHTGRTRVAHDLYPNTEFSEVNAFGFPNRGLNYELEAGYNLNQNIQINSKFGYSHTKRKSSELSAHVGLHFKPYIGKERQGGKQ